MRKAFVVTLRPFRALLSSLQARRINEAVSNCPLGGPGVILVVSDILSHNQSSWHERRCDLPECRSCGRGLLKDELGVWTDEGTRTGEVATDGEEEVNPKVLADAKSRCNSCCGQGEMYNGG